MPALCYQCEKASDFLVFCISFCSPFLSFGYHVISDFPGFTFFYHALIIAVSLVCLCARLHAIHLILPSANAACIS